MKNAGAILALVAVAYSPMACAQENMTAEVPIPAVVARMCSAIKASKNPTLRILAVYVAKSATPSDVIFVCAKAPPGVRHDQRMGHTLFSKGGHPLSSGNAMNLCSLGSNSGQECTNRRFVAPSTQREICLKSPTGNPNDQNSYECNARDADGKTKPPVRALMSWTYKKAGSNTPVNDGVLRGVPVVRY